MIPIIATAGARVKTLLDRLTQAWAAKLDDLHSGLNSRASRLDYLDVAVSTRGGGIKSIQRGTISVTLSPNGPLTGNTTVTISAVTTAKSMLHFHGWDGTSDMRASCRVALVSSNTVTAYACRMGNSGNDVYTVGYEIVEYY